MARSKTYQAKRLTPPSIRQPEAACDALIELPDNVKNQRKIDMRPWLGKGFDTWGWAFTSVMRSLIDTSNFSIASIVSMHANGIKSFMPFLIDGVLHFSPRQPDRLTAFNLKRFVTRTKLRYPNGSTAKNIYQSLKTLLTGMKEYGFIHAELEDLFPANPFPKSEIVLTGERPLSNAQRERLTIALRADLIARHATGRGSIGCN